MYTDTGFWDTFRSLFPLLNLIYPSINEEIQQGLLNTYKESGFLPEWASPGHRGIMVGNNSASVVADAYLKGLKGYDIETLYEAVLHGTKMHPTVSAIGRLGHEYYNTLGYVPYDVGIHENAARTLEYAYADWTIYKLAKALNRPQYELDLFAKRSQNYRNLYSAEHKLMRGRNEDGTFQSPFSLQNGVMHLPKVIVGITLGPCFTIHKDLSILWVETRVCNNARFNVHNASCF